LFSAAAVAGAGGVPSSTVAGNVMSAWAAAPALISSFTGSALPAETVYDP
jgi:hypothetical protein